METKANEKELVKWFMVRNFIDKEAERIIAFYYYLTEEYDDDFDVDETLWNLSQCFDSLKNLMFYNKGAYLILNDDEANERAKEEILNSIRDFNPAFLCWYVGITDVEAIEALQSTRNANETLIKLIKNNNKLERMIKDAIEADGRGHFIAKYDEDEYEQVVNNKHYYIYRLK